LTQTHSKFTPVALSKLPGHHRTLYKAYYKTTVDIDSINRLNY